MNKLALPDINLSAEEYTMHLINGTAPKRKNVKALLNNSTYIWCPKLPPSPEELKSEGMLESDIQQVWENFKEKIIRRRSNVWYHIHFHGDERTFWHALDKYAIVVNGYYFVCPACYIHEPVLLANGFKKTLMYVPVARNEGFMPITAESLDELIH